MVSTNYNHRANTVQEIKKLKADWRDSPKPVVDFAATLEKTFKSDFFVTMHGQPFKCGLLSMLVKEIERLDRTEKKWPYCQPFRLTTDIEQLCEEDLFAQIQRSEKLFGEIAQEYEKIGTELLNLGTKICNFGENDPEESLYKQKLSTILATFKEVSDKFDANSRMDHNLRPQLLAVSPLDAVESAESAKDIFFNNYAIYERNRLAVSDLLRRNWAPEHKKDIEERFANICLRRKKLHSGMLHVIMIPKDLVTNQLIYSSQPYGRIASAPLSSAKQARIITKKFVQHREEIFTVRLSGESKEFMRGVKQEIKELANRLTKDISNVYSLRVKPLFKYSFNRPFYEIHDSFMVFTHEFESEILNHYEKHEKSFDKYSIHGRMHVARALIFCEVMARYFVNEGKSVDLTFVRRLIGMHDAGRKGNGVDIWEKKSANLFVHHLISKGVPAESAWQKAQLIIKNRNHDSLEYTLFQSADSLDIMRPCTGHGGRLGFKASFFSFLRESASETDIRFREALINEAWSFIQCTEKLKFSDQFRESRGFIKQLFQVIEQHQERMPILSTVIKCPNSSSL